MKPIGWLLGTKVYDVQQREDAGFGAFYPDQTAIYSEHAKETILSTIRQAKVDVLREAAGNVTIWIKELEANDRYYVREQLQRMADEIERSKT